MRSGFLVFGMLAVSCQSEQQARVQPEPSHGAKRAIFLDDAQTVPLTFVYIAPETFMMGSPPGEPGKKPDEAQHRVVISEGFWIGITEVTQAQWKAVMGSNPSQFAREGTLPVEQVNWDDCTNFLAAANKRVRAYGMRLEMPTEAEWEFACRAGSKGRWCFGDDEDQLRDYAWYSENSELTTHPVMQKKPNAWGLYDMHGNVYEWVKDDYEQYAVGAVDPVVINGNLYKVLRGGSWSSIALGLRSANRVSKLGTERGIGGLRVVAR